MFFSAMLSAFCQTFLIRTLKNIFGQPRPYKNDSTLRGGSQLSWMIELVKMLRVKLAQRTIAMVAMHCSCNRYLEHEMILNCDIL